MTVGLRLYQKCLPKDSQLVVVYISILCCCVLVVMWNQPLLEFTMTARSRGPPALIFNGFKYLVNQKNASGKIYWRYAVNRKCGGSVTTEDGVLPML